MLSIASLLIHSFFDDTKPRTLRSDRQYILVNIATLGRSTRRHSTSHHITLHHSTHTHELQNPQKPRICCVMIHYDMISSRIDIELLTINKWVYYNKHNNNSSNPRFSPPYSLSTTCICRNQHETPAQPCKCVAEAPTPFAHILSGLRRKGIW